MRSVEIRCPVGPKKLFTKLKLGEEFGRYIHDGNLIEFTCSDCAKRIGRELKFPVYVFHYFNFLGELISTEVRERWICGTALTDITSQDP